MVRLLLVTILWTMSSSLPLDEHISITLSEHSTVKIVGSDDTHVGSEINPDNKRDGRDYSDDTEVISEINQDVKRDGKDFSQNTFNLGDINISGTVKANRITIGSHVNIGGEFEHDHMDAHDDMESHEDYHHHHHQHPERLAPGLGLNAEDEKELKTAFKYIDLNKDESLSADELYKACLKLDIKITENGANKMVIIIEDEEEKTGVNYVKFGHLLKYAPSFNKRDLIHFWVHAAGFHHGHDFKMDDDHEHMRHLYYVFLILDQDHDGQLTPNDLITAFLEMGGDLGQSEAENMIAVDMAGLTSGLSFEQWREMIEKFRDELEAKDLAEQWRKVFRFYIKEGEMTGYHRRHVDSGVRRAIGNEHIVQELNKLPAITRCPPMEVKAVEAAWIEVVEGLNYKLKIKIKTKAKIGDTCTQEIVKVCDNVVVFKPLPNICKGVHCLRLQDTEHIKCQGECSDKSCQQHGCAGKVCGDSCLMGDLMGWCDKGGECKFASAICDDPKVSYDAVRNDLVHLLTDSQDWWPADYGNYGPFFIRLAWHSGGSYRISDGRGGSDGGRLRFEPERSWDDNTNLDKARKLLEPIKEKYGDNLSWGDLIVLAGNTAIESMGGPILGFCGGRIDDEDGAESLLLGPSKEQEEFIPCEVNGECEEAFGTNTIGLIYVNPEGPMGEPKPEQSALQVREVFTRMDFNDEETVALIGGGHAFGKAHGACPHGAGPRPNEDSENPWPGKCGTGKGEDTFTSGFELPFTTKPTKWDNEYFKNLLDYTWKVTEGPGGHNQWHVEGGGPVAESVSGSHTQEIGLLTSDVAFTKDYEYLSIVKSWSTDMDSFNHAFSHAWYKLTTRDMGPATRCIGNNVPPPQPWQYPLPPPPKNLPNFESVKDEIKSILDSSSAGQLIRLSWQCSSTFRGTDYLGGCNGARIRFSPQKDWPVNVNLGKALDLLEPIKFQFGDQLSWADLIVLAGNAAVEHVGGNSMKFCGGRTDDDNGAASKYLAPKISGNFHETLLDLREYMHLMTLSPMEFAVINAAGYAVGARSDCAGLFCTRNSFVGLTAEDEPILSNVFFTRLLSNVWEEYTLPDSTQMYKAVDEDLYMLKTDFMFKTDQELLGVAHNYASDNQLFLDHFALTWTKLANIDRFDGPTGNLCN